MARLSTIQLATRDAVLVYQASAAVAAPRGSPASGSLAALLASTTHAFVGMGIAQDFKLVAGSAARATGGGASASAAAPPPQRLVELKKMGAERGVVVPGGLLGLAEALLGLPKWKSKRLQMSNWAAAPLSAAQIRYAAMDAHAGLACYDALLARPPPAPPLRHRAAPTPTGG